MEVGGIGPSASRPIQINSFTLERKGLEFLFRLAKARVKCLIEQAHSREVTLLYTWVVVEPTLKDPLQ